MTTSHLAPGLVLENPVSGTRTRFTATAASTGGAFVEVESTYPAHAPRPPLHHHPAQTEEFTVLTGSLSVVRDGESFLAAQGTSFSVAPGQRHQMWNDGDVEAVVRWRTTPALRTDELFCALWQVAHDHHWAPDPASVYDVVCRFADEFQLG